MATPFSRASFELLKDSTDKDVKIIFFTPLDQLDSNYYYKSVKTLALEYQEKFENVAVEYVDMWRDRARIAKYLKTVEGFSENGEKMVIVESGDRFAHFSLDDCLVYMQNDDNTLVPYAFNAEYRFTSSIMKVTRENSPLVTFVVNHAEMVPAAFRAFFEDSGFEVSTLDLLKDDIDPRCEILIMVSPERDITGIETEEEGTSEVTKLTSYLNGGGDMMIFLNPDTPVLKNLDELMEMWGISVLHGGVVQDEREYNPAATNRAVFASYYPGTERFSPLYEKVKSESKARIVSEYTVPLFEKEVGGTERTAQPVLISSPTGYVPLNASENAYEGAMRLMVASCTKRFNSEMEKEELSYLIVGGSTQLVSNQSLIDQSFDNAEFIKNMVSSLTDEKMALDIDYKVYNDTSLDVDPIEKNSLAAPLILVLPAIVLIAATVVFLKRRHL